MVFLMWLIYFIEISYSLNFSVFGILPRELPGLIGIILAPLLHGSVVHLISNTFPLLFLGTTLFYFYYPVGSRVFLLSYFGVGIFVWLFARPVIHIGASGLIYSIAAFLVASGLFRKQLYALLIGLVVALVYGGLVFGLMPSVPGVSWESHMIGALIGVFLAFYYRDGPRKRK